MSGYSEASRQAFKRVDVTGGQRKIIDFLRARPRLRPTRQEVANLSGMKLQTVCARVNELLYDFNPPMLKELPVRDGAHPLELIENAAGQMPAMVTSGDEANASGKSSREQNQANDSAYHSAPTAPQPVTPYIPGRWSMSLDAAKQIAKDSGNAFVEEARKVIQTGAYWVR